MIGIDIIRKKRKTAGTGGGSVGSGISTPSGGDAQNAVHADNADHANRADEAAHAASAKELDGTSSVWNTIRTWISGATDAMKGVFLRKDQDDETVHKLTMGEAEVKGALTVGGNSTVGGAATVNGVSALKGGATFGTGGYKFDEKGNLVVSEAESLGFDEALERGFGIKKNAQGKYTLSVTDLMVWGKAVFNSLEIRKLYAVGGNVYLSGASSKIVRVVPVKRATAASSSTEGDTSETWVACAEGDADCEGWKCYTLNDDGTTATQNGWRKYDQAKCQTFDIKDGAHDGVSNTFYWRLVADASTENETITETRTETYVDDDGVTKTREVTVDLYDGKKFGWVVLSKTDCEDPKTNDAPKAGDTIVLDGHRMFESGDPLGRDQYNDESRTNVLMLETTGTQDGTLPRIVALTGIVNYKHSEDDNHPYSNTVFILSPKKVVFVSSSFEWIGASGDPITLVNFRGNWTEDAEYGYYDQVSHNDSIWTCVVEKGTKTTEEPSDTSKDWRKEISIGTPEIAKLRVDHSALHYNPATKKWDYDSVTVTIVIFTPDGTKILSSNDVSEYYWMLDTDTTITERKSGWGFSAPTDDAASRTVTLYKKYKKEDGSEASVAIDTITVPMVRDGAPGADGKDAPIMVCLYAVGQSNTFSLTTLNTLEFDDNGVLTSYDGWEFTAKDAGQYYLWQASFLGYRRGNGTYIKADKSVDESYICLTGPSGSQGASGKDALEIVCDPETIVLDTDIDGRVTGLTNATAVLKCMRNGVTVSGVTYNIGKTVNCSATVDSNGKVTITSVTSQSVTIDGNTVTVSSTSGSVTVNVTVSGVTYTKTVPFTVNVARYTGGLKWDNKKLQSKYSLLTNDGHGGSITSLTEYKSQILQTAKEISLKVSEKSVGRRNMLVGSACRKYGDGFTYMSGSQTQYYNGYPLEQIEINSGIDGVNCIHCRTKQYATDGAYLSGFRWNGGSPQGNIKLEKGKNYVLSFYAKTHTPNDIVFVAEVLYQGSNIDTSRPDGYAGPTGYSTTVHASEADKWELFTVKLSVPSDAPYEYVEICIFARATGYSFVDGYICKPMLEEGDEYNGWTLSEQDYDYVGGNLLDGTGTLTKTGNVDTLDEKTVKQGGYNNESASVGATLSPTAAYNDFLRYSTTKMGLKAGEDYMLSFYARSSGKGILQCYLYDPSTGYVLTESSQEKEDYDRNPGDGDLRTPIAPATAWKRYWVHWRPMGNVPKYILFRLLRPGTDKGSYNSSTSYNVGDVVLYGGTYYVCKKAGSGYELGVPGSSSYWEASWFSIEIARPKLEVGATMTEWTEKRADMVDKRALLATGIDIYNKKIIATTDNFVVRNNSGETTLNLDEDGNLQAGSLTTMDNGRGWTEIEGSTTIWRRADGEPGIQVFYDETGAPHLQFMMKVLNSDGSLKEMIPSYDLGPTGIKSLLDNKHDAYTERVLLYGYLSSEPSGPLSGGDTATTYYKFHKAVYPVSGAAEQDKDAQYDGKVMYYNMSKITGATGTADGTSCNVYDNNGKVWISVNGSRGPLFIADGWYGVEKTWSMTDGSGNTVRRQTVGYYSGGILRTTKLASSY